MSLSQVFTIPVQLKIAYSDMIFFAFFLLFLVILQPSDTKRCAGGDVEKLPDLCEVIEGVLLITGNVSEEVLKWKLQSVESIKGGLIVKKTILKEFHFLVRLKSIENKLGYAVVFSGNEQLARFQTPKRLKLNGAPKAILFENDNLFRTIVKFQGEALGDLAAMSLASSTSDCYDVTVVHRRVPDALTLTMICLNAILLVSCIGACAFMSSSKRSGDTKNKKGPEAVEEGHNDTGRRASASKMFADSLTVPTKSLPNPPSNPVGKTGKKAI